MGFSIKNTAIRQAEEADLLLLEDIASKMGTRHEAGYFERCLSEQKAGNRLIFLAQMQGKALAYAQLNWKPVYAGFSRFGIPEIQDLNVVPDARRQGLGAFLIDYCEGMARKAGKAEIGISVSVSPRFGAAQRLYMKRGYVPDGAGAAYDDMSVAAGEVRPIDDLLTLKCLRTLGN